jgi:predicted alpha/beta superfamily hydrolase
MSVASAESWSVESADRHELSDPGSGRSYEIGVALPMSYAATDRKYPAVVVLDGNFCFGTMTETARLQAPSGMVQEVVVIGVGTPRREGFAAHVVKRLWDLTPAVPGLDGADSGLVRMLFRDVAAAGLAPARAFGGADRFLAFLTDQLLPFIAGRYRIDTADLGLFGHSAGGLFAVHALLTPGSPFTRYTAGSFPGDWLGEGLPARVEAFRQRAAGRRVRVYCGVGATELDYPATAAGLKAGMELLDRLAAPPAAGIDLLQRIYPDETHASVLAPLLSSGLRWHYGTGLTFAQAVAPHAAGEAPAQKDR